MKAIKTRLTLLNKENSNTKAVGDMSYDNCIIVKGIRVIEGENGLFVSMPQSVNKEGKYTDKAYAISEDLRNHISETVIGQYNKQITDDKQEKIYLTDKKEFDINKIDVTARATPADIAKKPWIKALATVTIDNDFVITGLSLCESKDHNLYVKMPQVKEGDTYKDRIYGENKEIQNKIKSAIVGEYNKTLNKSADESNENVSSAYKGKTANEGIDDDYDMEYPV